MNELNTYLAVLPALSGVLSLALGLFTLSRNPGQLTNVGFAIGLTSLVVTEAGACALLLSEPGTPFGKAGLYLLTAGMAAVPPFWLAFTTSFGRTDKRVLARWAPVIGGTVAAGALLVYYAGSGWFIVPDSARGSVLGDQVAFVITPAGRLFFIYLILGQVLNLIQLENTLRSSSAMERWRIKYIVFGVGSILAFFVYIATQALLFSTVVWQSLLALSVVIMVSTVMMGVFIIRHRLLDVDIFISRYVVYNSLTVIAIGLYLLAVGLIVHGIKFFNLRPLNDLFSTLFVFLSVLALMVVLFMTKIRRKAKLFINRHFYKHKYEFRDKWMETTEKISSKRGIGDICNTMIGMVQQTMGARTVNIWLSDYHTGDSFTSYSGNTDGPPTLYNNHALVFKLKNRMEPFFLVEPGEGDGGGREKEDIMNIKKSTGAEICAPLVAGRNIVGFMLVGGDISGEPYTGDDFELLKAITTQAAVQIRNIQLTKDLMGAREIEAFGKMSSFIIHDLKNLTNSLSLVGQNAKDNISDPDFQKDAVETINDTVTKMKGLIEKLSSIPRGLDIRKELVDVGEVVRTALEKVDSSGKGKGPSIDVDLNSLPPIELDPDAFEMVCINLVTNALEAIENNGNISICGSVNGRYFKITVSDDGAGIPEDFLHNGLFNPFKSTKKHGFGIGLYQCKAIVEAHGGSINATSTEGSGTTFTIKLPLLPSETKSNR